MRVLELEDGTLVPLVSDAVRSVDFAARRIEIDEDFLGLGWRSTSSRSFRAGSSGSPSSATCATRWPSATRSTFVDLRATTPLKAGQVDDTPYGGGAGMVIRVDVVEAALQRALRRGPARAAGRRRVIALAAGGRRFDDALATSSRRSRS